MTVDALRVLLIMDPLIPVPPSHYGGIERLSFVRVGTLDEPSALPPDVHIYTRSKLPWIVLPPNIPAFDAYYDSKKLWPAESLERRKAVFARPA